MVAGRMFYLSAYPQLILLALRSTGGSKFSCFMAAKSKSSKANVNLYFHPAVSAVWDDPDEEQTHLKHHFWSTPVFERYRPSRHLTEFVVYVCLRCSVEAFVPTASH